MAQLFVGLMAEGVTDYRFLRPIVEKTFVNIAFECQGQIDIDVQDVDYVKPGRFADYVADASMNGLMKYGIMTLVVHSDADFENSSLTYQNKINPAIEFLGDRSADEFCKSIVPLIPVFETEAWMLADKGLFKKVIGTNKSDAELGIEGNPESLSNPKERIENAIKIGRSHMPKKLRGSLQISDMYSILGEMVSVDKLSLLQSYIEFTNNIRREMIQLNMLQA